MSRSGLFRLLVAGLLTANVTAGLAAQDTGSKSKGPFDLKKIKAAGRTAGLGSVNSVAPCGSDTGAPKCVTFTMTATFSGVNNRTDVFTRTITVMDSNGSVVVTGSEQMATGSGEQGCIACPASTTATALKPGAYIVIGTLTDQTVDAQGNPIGPPVNLDAKVCVYNLAP